MLQLARLKGNGEIFHFFKKEIEKSEIFSPAGKKDLIDQGSDFRGYNLKGKDMTRAYLYDADLRGVDLGDVKLESLEQALKDEDVQGILDFITSVKESAIASPIKQILIAQALQSQTQEGFSMLQLARLKGEYTYKSLLVAIEISNIFSRAGQEDLIVQGSDFRGYNLKGKDLDYAYLSFANFENANLEGANLSGANFTWAKLNGANLAGADLTFANLGSAELAGADLGNATLTNAILASAKMHGANLRGANMQGAILKGAYLTGAKIQKKMVDAFKAAGANLKDADIPWFDFELFSKK
jgi:uncharacterized protein YjbI with pentapeptide repeats